MKKGIAWILLAAVAVLLCACGGTAASSDPNAGVYEAVSAEAYGISISVEDAFKEFSLELLDKGKARFHYEGKSYNMKWTLEGTDFHAEGGGAKLNGTLADGTMVLKNVQDSGIDITLVNAAYAAPGGNIEDLAGLSTTPAPDYAAWWAGDWYGWWIVAKGRGVYEQYVDRCADLCARIEVTGDTGTIVIWDTADSIEKPLCEAEVAFGPGSTEAGSMRSLSGVFTDVDIVEDEWQVDPGRSQVSTVEHMICIEGTYVDPDYEGSTLDYLIFLRPWGMDWEDVRGVNIEDALYENMLPPHYDDWYLPQIQG